MMTITAPDGTPVEIFASQSGEFVDTCLRATDRDTWVQAAISQNLLYQDPIIERTTDEATGEVTETIVGYEDEIKVSAGVNITEIGPIVLVPGEYDEEDGSEVKAPVMDNRFHLNMRIAEPLLSKVGPDGYPLWQKTALTWMKYGKPVQPNSAEHAVEVAGVQMIDPDSIKNPDRIWF